ncbi:hypothetical protein [Maribacter litoralis]|uniref:hypothetical protein n=1 Tax=Maribacter litoralis TaxID=2059726 RepID=UPI003F5CD909
MSEFLNLSLSMDSVVKHCASVTVEVLPEFIMLKTKLMTIASSPLIFAVNEDVTDRLEVLPVTCDEAQYCALRVFMEKIRVKINAKLGQHFWLRGIPFKEKSSFDIIVYNFMGLIINTVKIYFILTHVLHKGVKFSYI